MKKSEVKNKHKNKDWNLKNILSIWYLNRKIFPDRILRNHKAIICAHGGMQQWGVNYWDFFSSGKMDKFEVNIRNRTYIWIANHINWLCTWFYPILPWCGCLHGSYFSNGSWFKQRIMGPKVKQTTSFNQSIKCKLVLSSKNWSIKEVLSSISSWPLFILHKRISYFTLCWWLYNSFTLTIDNRNLI